MNIGVYDAVLTFHKGAVSELDVIKALGLKCSESVDAWLQLLDVKRVREAEKKFEMNKRRKGNAKTRKKKGKR